MYKKLELFF